METDRPSGEVGRETDCIGTATDGELWRNRRFAGRKGRGAMDSVMLPYFTGIRITTGKWIKNGDYAV